ncbi:dedicator of cytokinesis protein 11 isoform X2 [Diachasma alloeum]|uniref:dedicator of cytokinesis protein 11 isoform X2 n=1 Tax=Diachasma alloeum TaxID=454923 RepID=UPI0007381286|nr:dedicator of cytokinesis protein 11 isoform X2 [Diachasma alloeum]
MSERKFTRALGKPGMAAQLRETVSQVVRESTVQNKPRLVDPVDFENFVLKNRTLLQNDPQRELLLYPPDDVSQVVLPRKCRTVELTAENILAEIDGTESLLTRECLKSYASNWNMVHYKYAAYSGTYMELPKLSSKLDELKDEIYEIDTDVDQIDEDMIKNKNDGITKEGYLMKGPEIGLEKTDRMFAHIGSKSFKRRFCNLHQEVDGTYILELFKDEKKSEAKLTIVMDFCTEVVKNSKRGRYCFELRMSGTEKSYTFGADSESEMQDWLLKLNLVLQHYKQQDYNDKHISSLEPPGHVTPPLNPLPPSSSQSVSPIYYGTLKGLDQSMNPQLIKYSRETDTSILLARRENRKRLFNLYNSHHNYHFGGKNPSPIFTLSTILGENNNKNINPYEEHFGQRIFIKCEALKFRLQAPIDDNETLCQVEPYQTSLCLFDARQGRKLSENFYFDVNNDIARNMMAELTPIIMANDKKATTTTTTDDYIELKEKYKINVNDKWLKYVNQAIFSISNPHPDIFLVVRIEKVLQGNIYQTAEPYIKATKDPRLGLKVHKNVKACYHRLGNYRMPFAWSARPLFRLYSNELDTSSDFPAIYRQEINRMRDDDIIKLLSEYRKPEKLSKLTVIPGWLKLHVETINDIPENTLTTSLEPIQPFPIPPTTSPTLEILEFESPSERDVLHPYTTYRNNLYVYPQSLNFDTQKFFNRARNISCIVELRDNDEVDDEREGKEALKCIYDKSNSIILSNRGSCPVLHHSVTPSWYEEIKIKLPNKLHAKHHLLFSFYHISCDMNKKKENCVENCVGYSWINLLNKGKLVVDMEINLHSLPVATHLPSGYLSIEPLGLGQGNSGPDVTWIDAQRPIFTVSFHLTSTIFTRDLHLHNLFVHAEKIIDRKVSSTVMPSDTETCKILKAAHAIQLVTAITFLPTILNQLFALLISDPAEEVCLCIIRLLIHIINSLHEAERRDVLQAYVKFVFVALSSNGTINSPTTVHQQLAKYLPTLLQPSNTDFLIVNKFMHHSNFFFEIMVKSMAQHMLTTGRIKMHRNERFPHDYYKAIKKLLEVIMPYLMIKYKEMPTETHELNKSLAQFFKKCLTFMDRGFVFTLINQYMSHFTPGDSRTLQDYKFIFLQIICSHEHYISLNLPMMQTRVTTKDLLLEYCLSQEFCKHHFLVGLLLQEVKSSLNEIVQIRKMAITTLADLLAKHELDDRYENKGQMSRIAAIYIPWLGIVLENLHRLETVYETDDKYNNKIELLDNNRTTNEITTSSNRMPMSNSFFNNTNNNNNNNNSNNKDKDRDRDKEQIIGNINNETPKSMHRLTLHLDTPSPKRASIHLRDSTYFAAIAGQNLANGFSCTSIESNASTLSSASHSHVSQETTIACCDSAPENDTIINDHRNVGHLRSLSVTQTSPRCDKLQSSEMKDLLICFLFVMKYLGDHQIIAWWQQCSDNEIQSFFTVIEMSLHHFKYDGKRQIISKINANTNVKTAKTVKAMTLPARIVPPNFSSDNSATGTLQPHNIPSSTRENLIDGEEENGKFQTALVEANISTEVGLIVLDCLGLFCIHFKEVLLVNDGDNSIMEKLFFIYLKFLEIGQSESLYRHVFASFRAYLNNYSIVLFNGSAVLCGLLCHNLLRCCNSKLSSIRQESCALLYLLMRSNFEYTNRKGLTRVHLQVIISVSQMLGSVIGLNNSRFQESLSLINSYASSDKAMKGTGFPFEVKDLIKRIRTVLMATAQMREHNDNPEMLVDLQHSLANSYASTPELRHTWLETMARNHSKNGDYSEAACCQLHIAALMAEYLKLKKIHDWGSEAFDKISINISKDERGLKLDAGVQDVHYNSIILLEQLEKCAEMLEKAERFELLGPLYRLIIPILENKRDYNALATCYSHLSQACNKIVEVTRTGKRLLGRFYRVAFFGSAYFEEENSQEYIYKEPKVTSLSEMSERLNRLYADKFGPENVKMIMDSAPIDKTLLDTKVAYIQVTHVTPYFENKELETRVTEFQHNHDVSSFMFETPFTKEGKPHGNPEDQWKRRTILFTPYAFPYIKKRICIIDKKIIELTPIEVALDEMRQRVQELQDVTLILPTDIKKLQLRLQGSVCVTVNAGPLAYASAFLDPALSPQYPDDKVEQLRDVFRDFIKICYTALQINSKLITTDQQEYQRVLRDNYYKLCENMSPLLGESIWPGDLLDSFKRNSSALFSAISGSNNNPPKGIIISKN